MDILNSTYEFPDDFVETLVCAHCKAYLSCGPIKVKADGGTICGRCSGSNMEGSIRHSLFESVMAKFMFPCRFKKQGCGQQLVFGAVEHEDICPYHTYACPSLPHGTCSQNVSVFDVYKHFEESHDDLIVKDNKFRLDLQADVQCNLLVSIKNVVAVVQYMYDSDKQDLYIDITHFSNDLQKRLSYKLQIVSGSVLDRVITFEDCSCRLYECHVINQQNSRHFKLSNYLPALEHPAFVFVNIMLHCVDGGANSRENFSQMDVVNSLPLSKAEQKINKIIAELETIRCGCCYSIAVPPVYRCENYDPPRIECVKCKSTDTRYTTEELLVKIPEFPCRWRPCSFVGNQDTVRNHIESCQFQSYICPLLKDCFSGFYTHNTMMNHIQQHDGQFCSNPERIVIDLYYENPVEKHYFTIFKNRLVAFTYFIKDTSKEWVLYSRDDQLVVSDTLSYDIHFEHEHCSYTSKTFSYSRYLRCQLNNVSYYLPECFKTGKCWWAVLKIKN